MPSNIQIAIGKIKNGEEAIHVADYVNSDDISELRELTTKLGKSQYVTLLGFNHCVFDADDTRLLFSMLKANRVLINLQLDKCQLSEEAEDILLQGLPYSHSLLYFSRAEERINKSFNLSVDEMLLRNKQLFDGCYVAAKEGDTKTCLQLLDMGVSPYAIQTSTEIDGSRNTILHCAVMNGHVDTVRALLNYYHEHNFDVDYLDNAEKTAFDVAYENLNLFKNEKHTAVEMLIQNHLAKQPNGGTLNTTSSAEAVSLQDGFSHLMRVIYDNLTVQIAELSKKVTALLQTRNTQRLTDTVVETTELPSSETSETHSMMTSLRARG